VITYYYPLVFTKYNTKYNKYNYNHNDNAKPKANGISNCNGLILGKLKA